MENAIKKAIEGGWKPTKYLDYKNNDQMLGLNFFLTKFSNDFLLAPLFWQALGKQQGWQQVVICGNCQSGNSRYQMKLGGLCTNCGCDFGKGLVRTQKGYIYEWHALIDWVAEGKDINDFFNQLLK